MAITYSTYEAKARFSEVLRQVREGTTVTVTYRGEPVAEIRPIEQRPRTTEERLDELERRGELVPPTGPSKPLRAVMDRPGALAEFLADRDE
ncbi:MAG: type II toxin-antitoxin system prevent-host-death family antitoxin [Chloroflexi bacterium]|nr:type II toxin-antitoxin system prevent-host-death family antitoxin [Chloroflexota bacterium]